MTQAPGRFRLMVISGISGLAWGLVGQWFLSDTGLKSGAWMPLAASPLIGILIGHRAARVSSRGFVRQLGASLVNLYVAVSVFILVVALWQVTLGWDTLPLVHQKGRWASFWEVVTGLSLGFTFSGWALLLWPLSWGNHALIWRLSSGSDPEHPLPSGAAI